MSDYAVLYEAKDGYRTYRIVNDPEPALVITCPVGELGDLCGVLHLSDEMVDDPIAVFTGGVRMVESMRLTECTFHAPKVVGALAGRVDAQVLSVTPEMIAALAEQVLTTPPAGEYVTPEGTPVYDEPTEREMVLDENGNPVLDYRGEPTYREVSAEEPSSAPDAE